MNPSTLLILLTGTILGSFASMVAYRLINNKSLLRHRSFCEQCDQNLGPIELLPIVSFIAQKGKCKQCKNTIDPTSTITEISLAGLFVLLLFNTQSPINLIGFFILSTLLAINFITDYKTQFIYDIALYPALITAILLAYYNEYFFDGLILSIGVSISIGLLASITSRIYKKKV
jgi:leader peptidase (prepilin peptidase) / N-methyltransferase